MSSNQLSILIVAIILCCFGTNLHAGIYCCEKEDGSLEYRGSPCQNDQIKQTFFPISYNETDPKIVKQQEKEVELANQKFAKMEQAADKLRQKTAKQREKEKEKEERRQVRCQRINEKILKLEADLRRGSKAKRYKRLQEELLHCQKMKARYCSQSSLK